MIEIDGKSLTLEDFRRVAMAGEECSVGLETLRAVQRGRELVAAVEQGDVAIYGINTGFGELARNRIPRDKLRSLQRRLLLSHAAGVGPPLPDPAVRGMILLRANALARGHSGVRPEVVELLVQMLNTGILPVVPRRGSVGASGDLAPLAHLALPLIGVGTVKVDGRELEAADALSAAGLAPLTLEAKEGLALINGTQAMTSLVALAAIEAHRLAAIADLVGAMSTDALRGTDAAFDPRIQELRPYPGQLASAANLTALLQGSEIRESHREGDDRIQDPYSIRCMPQVHGAVRGVLADVEAKLAIEMNAVTDNPLVFPSEAEILSGGNFHGEPMALAADILAVALAELGSMSERRIEKLTNSAFSWLPSFLVEDAGLNSGFMMAQVTAAALVSESKVLCHPASVDSIPTSADKEDHVSMGMGAALKLHQVAGNVRQVLAIELLAGAQGIDLLRPLRSSPRLEALHDDLRRIVGPWHEDRHMAPDLEAAARFLVSGVQPHLRGLA